MMKESMKRVFLILLADTLLTEVVDLATVHASDSTGSILGLCQMLLAFIALAWAVLPAVGGIRSTALRVVARSSLVLVLFAGLHAFGYLYFWHIRPNLGLYREHDWVTRNTEARQQITARIEANKW